MKLKRNFEHTEHFNQTRRENAMKPRKKIDGKRIEIKMPYEILDRLPTAPRRRNSRILEVLYENA